MNQRNRLISNSILNVGSIFVNGALQVIIVPILLTVLKDNGVGILAAMGTFHIYSMLLNLGFGSAIDRYIPQHLVRNEMDHINIVVNTALVYFMVVLPLIVISTAIIASNFTNWFNVTPDLSQTAIIGIYITGLLLAVRMPLIPYGAVLSGMQRYDLLRITELGVRTLRSAAIIGLIWFLPQRSALIFVIVLNALDPLLASLLGFWLAHRHLPGLKVRLNLARWACFQAMFGYSINNFLYSVGTLIITESSIFIILLYMSDSEAGHYAIPLYLIRFINLIVIGFTQGIKPAVSKLEAEGNFEQVRQILLRGSRYANLLIISICIGLAVISKLLLVVWVGALHAELWPLLTIMALGYGAFYSQYPSFFVMAGLGSHVVFGIIIIVIAILNIVLSVAFLTYTHWGLIGVAAGSALPLFISSILVIPVYTCRRLGIPLGQYLYYTILQPFLVTVPLLLLCGAASYWGMDHPAVSLAALVIVGSIVFALCLWKFGLTDSDKSVFIEMRRHHLPFLRGWASQLAK